jgi:hypothetical protein
VHTAEAMTLLWDFLSSQPFGGELKEENWKWIDFEIAQGMNFDELKAHTHARDTYRSVSSSQQ